MFSCNKLLMRYFLQLSCSLALVLQIAFVHALTPVLIKEEKANYILDVQYPQGFESKEINASIKALIDKTLDGFYQELAEDADTPDYAPGKTGLHVTYSIPYQTDRALSVRFAISIFHRGAAHPVNNIVVNNYINGRPVQLADLFNKGVDYLKPIAAFSNKTITAKKISDPEWIKEGTKPLSDNYRVWYFTEKGIAIVFNSYDVAAYVFGEQIVEIPLSLIASLLKPELIKTVWSH